MIKATFLYYFYFSLSTALNPQANACTSRRNQCGSANLSSYGKPFCMVVHGPGGNPYSEPGGTKTPLLYQGALISFRISSFNCMILEGFLICIFRSYSDLTFLQIRTRIKPLLNKRIWNRPFFLKLNPDSIKTPGSGKNTRVNHPNPIKPPRIRIQPNTRISNPGLMNNYALACRGRPSTRHERSRPSNSGLRLYMMVSH